MGATRELAEKFALDVWYVDYMSLVRPEDPVPCRAASCVATDQRCRTPPPMPPFRGER
jgi:hypothetical protein